MIKDLYSDTSIASGAIDELWQEDNIQKGSIVRLWEQCAKYVNGDQGSALWGTYTRSDVSISEDAKKQSYMTNEIDPIVRTLISFMTRSRPSVEFTSADKSQEAKWRAQLAEKIHNAKYIIDSERDISRRAAAYGIVFGTAVRKTYWDESAGSDAEVPVFDELGNEVIDPNTGDVATRQTKTGDVKSVVLPPFGIAVDWSCTDFKDLHWIIEGYLMPVEWAKQAFGVKGQGYTGAEIIGGSSYGTSIDALERMKYAVPLAYGASGNSKKDKILIKECYLAPTNEYRKGRLIIKAGDRVVFDSLDNGSPYYMPYQDVMWHPYSFYKQQEYVGRLFGKGVVEGQLPLQMRLNEINSSILINANTIAKPEVLALKNQLVRGVFGGTGTKIQTFKHHPSGFVPIKWAGQPLPSQFFNERQIIIDAMVREAGTNFIMNGQPPTGVSAAAALELLLENSTSQQSDAMLAFADFHQDAYTKKMRLIRKFNNLPNKMLIDYIKSIDNDVTTEKMDVFIGQDLGDGLNVKVNPASMIPKTDRAKRDVIEKMVAGPLAQFVSENSPRGAKLRKNIMNEFGLDSFDLSEAVDVEKATWENERVKRGESIEVWDEDDHMIHIQCHLDDMKRPQYIEKVAPDLKQIHYQHVMIHKQKMQEQAIPPPPAPPLNDGSIPMPPPQGM